MKAFIDFLPVLLFFLSYIFYGNIPVDILSTLNTFFSSNVFSPDSTGIYFATFILMFSYSIQFLILVALKKAEKIHWITLFIILIAGAATLYLKNPFFIKIKPTIVYFGFALIFLIYQVWKRESLVKRMLANHVNLNDANYNFLNSFWIFFFVFSGILNYIVASLFEESIWVDFKFYVLGILLPIIFILINGIYLSKKIKD